MKAKRVPKGAGTAVAAVVCLSGVDISKKDLGVLRDLTESGKIVITVDR